MADKIIAYKVADTGTVALPSDMSSVNTVICIGGGAGGCAGSNYNGGVQGAGGTSGAIHIATNVTLTASQSVQIGVGAGGAGGAGDATVSQTAARGGIGSDTWLNGTTLANGVVGAQGGQLGANSYTAGAGGASFGTAGGTKTNGSAAGGPGIFGNGNGSGAGAPGTTGAGGAGASGGANTGGSGGGGANGGSAGTASTGSTGAAGGNNRLAAGGGAGGAANTVGTVGTAGGGGGGGGASTGGGAAGSQDGIWVITDGTYAGQTLGPGSGGASGGSFAANGGAAGGFGAGGGGSAKQSGVSGGAGSPGLIIIIYTPATASSTTTTFGGGMAIGIGIGVSFPRMMGGVTASSPTPSPSPSPTAIPDISPGVGWLTTADSVTATFVDPPRTTAKPGLNPLMDGGFRCFDSSDLIIGVQAFANGGISAVQCEIEGNIYSVPLNSYTFNDANGVSRTVWGYFARLDYSAWSGDGTANVRWKATPSDGTQQARVIGPFTYTRRTTLNDFTVTVAASATANGTTIFNTLGAARTYLRSQSAQNPLITITETGTYMWGQMTSGVEYAGGTGYCTITHSPGVTAALRVLNTPAVPWVIGSTNTPDNTGNFSLDYNGIEFKGSGIVIDHEYMLGFYHSFGTNMGTKPLVLNGCEIYSSGGRYSLRNSRLTEGLLGGNPVGGAVALEVHLHDMMNGFCGQGQSNAKSWIALRNCLVHDIAGDVTYLCNNFYGLTCYNIHCEDYRTPVAAMTLRYNGADATATFEKTGSNGDPGGTLILKSGGITRLTVALTFEKSVQTVVNEINTALSGSSWVAATSAGHATWDAEKLYDGVVAGFGPTTAARDVKGITYQLYTAVDAHGDIVQPSTGQTVQNLTYVNCNGYEVREAQHLFITDQNALGAFDVFLVNYAACGVPAVAGFKAHFDNKVRNLNIWNSVFGEQTFEVDASVDSDTYCSIKNSIFKTFTKTGTFLGTIDGCHFITGSAPTGATNSVTGSSLAALLTAATTGDYSPKAAGPLTSQTSLVGFDLLNAARSASSHIGAVA